MVILSNDVLKGLNGYATALLNYPISTKRANERKNNYQKR